MTEILRKHPARQGSIEALGAQKARRNNVFDLFFPGSQTARHTTIKNLHHLALPNGQTPKQVTVEQLQKLLELNFSYTTLGPSPYLSDEDNADTVNNLRISFSLKPSVSRNQFRKRLGVKNRYHYPDTLTMFLNEISSPKRTNRFVCITDMRKQTEELSKETLDFLEEVTGTTIEASMREDQNRNINQIQSFFWTRLCTWLNQVLAGDINQSMGYSHI